MNEPKKGNYVHFTFNFIIYSWLAQPATIWRRELVLAEFFIVEEYKALADRLQVC